MEVSEQVRFDVSESLVCFDVFHMSDDVSATLHPSEDRVSDSISHSSATYQSQHHIPLVPSAAPYFPPLPTLHTNARRHMYFIPRSATRTRNRRALALFTRRYTHLPVGVRDTSKALSILILSGFGIRIHY
jgi:hypothetical protein